MKKKLRKKRKEKGRKVLIVFKFLERTSGCDLKDVACGDWPVLWMPECGEVRTEGNSEVVKGQR